MNDSDPAFHVEYLRFETKYLDKVMARKEVLKPSKVDFVDDSEPDDVKLHEPTDDANLVAIAWNNLKSRFSSNVLVMQSAKKVLKQSLFVPKVAPQLFSEAR